MVVYDECRNDPEPRADVRPGTRRQTAWTAARSALLTLCCVLLGGLLAGADHPAPGAAAAYPWADTTSPYGIAGRTPLTTSRVAGSPGPLSPYVSERRFPRLHFSESLELVNAPDNQRWFVAEHPGLIYSFPKQEDVERADLFLDIRRKDARYLDWTEQRDIWSIAFHPKYLSNGYVYVCYRDPIPRPGRCRISRFSVDLGNPAAPPTCDPASEFIILEWISAIDHHGGCLRFGPKDGCLYFSAGDGSAGYDGNNTGQDISDLNAAIMRIDVDHVQNGRSYAIPADNPFVAVAGARGEIWAYGLRNVWKMGFDHVTGDLWAGDVGQDLWDMIDHVEKGGNYGWSILEGTHPMLPERARGPTPILAPAAEHNHSEIRSITAGYVYRGDRLPELKGRYIYGDFETGRVYSFTFDGKQASKPELIAETTLRIVGFAEDGDGELLILDYTGTVNRLAVRKPQANLRPFPARLSETGLFASVADLTPAPGMIPYEVNSPLWSDGASKSRFIALPAGGKIEFSPTDAWRFPEGTVLVKTFSLAMRSNDPSSSRRLETRLLHFEEGQWRYYTYVWNDEQSDALLLGEEARDIPLTITDSAAPGGRRMQTWHVPSRVECTVCHNQAPGFTLGLTTAQLNRTHDYGGIADNQLRVFSHLDLFTQPIANSYKRSDPAAPSPKVLRLPDPYDASEPLENRARAYLHANCSHCHRMWGGGNATFNLLYTNPLRENRIIDTVPDHGSFGIADARLLAPGHPERSVILERMGKLGIGRMPLLATSVVDEQAVALVRDWIASLGSTGR
jgi:uncharacterized repeat protein (TIGR03806 family)